MEPINDAPEPDGDERPSRSAYAAERKATLWRKIGQFFGRKLDQIPEWKDLSSEEILEDLGTAKILDNRAANRRFLHRRGYFGRRTGRSHLPPTGRAVKLVRHPMAGVRRAPAKVRDEDTGKWVHPGYQAPANVVEMRRKRAK